MKVLYLHCFDLQYNSVSFRVLSKVFSSPQICQKSWLFIPLLKTELLNRYTIFFFPTLHFFSTVSFISESIISLHFYFFPLVPREELMKRFWTLAIFLPACFSERTNVQNKVKIFCDIIAIWDHIFWTPTFKLPFQDKQTNLTKKPNKVKPHVIISCYTPVWSYLKNFNDEDYKRLPEI